MKDAVTLTPYNTCNNIDEIMKERDSWSIQIDHATVHACPEEWNFGYIIYKIVKKHHFMTYRAHFYGKEAYGVLIPENESYCLDTKKGKQTIKDMRRATFVLCSNTGTCLPEISTEYYPKVQRATCKVNFSCFKNLSIGKWVWLEPDINQVDLNTTPRKDWIYDIGGPPHLSHPKQYGVGICVLELKKERIDGRLRYIVVGPILDKKIIATPLMRNVGTHHAPGYLENKVLALRGIKKNRYKITTKRKVLLGHDFHLSGLDVRIVSVTENGFEVSELN